MRAGCAIYVFHCVLLATCSVGAEEFPYKAYMNASDVYVRSGPGKNYYPTDKLQRGAEVEVYRHDPGGWYAIRPPEDSFSWISGAQLNILEDNLAEVTQPDVVAYVGSKFSDVHDVRQVKLEQGELVEIVGEKRFVTPDNGNAETWYKIAPPRGEFRWVFGRFVVPQGIAGTTAEHADPAELPRSPNRWSKVNHSAELAAAPRRESTDDPRQIGTDGDTESVTIPAAAYEGGETNISLTSAQTLAADVGEGGLVYSTTRPTTRRMSQIEKLDGDLSLIVAEPPAKWDFQSVRMRAQAAVDNAASALERGRAKDLLNQIARYEQLRAGYAQIDTIREQTDQQNQMVQVATAAAPVAQQPAVSTTTTVAASPPASVVPSTVPVTTPSSAASQTVSTVDLSQFDGVGQLRPVQSRRAGAPRFALTGQSGEVLMFLSASPGVNLDRYVGQYVGLTGKRGYMPKLQQAHLTVAQAQPLSSGALVARQP